MESCWLVECSIGTIIIFCLTTIDCSLFIRSPVLFKNCQKDANYWCFKMMVDVQRSTLSAHKYSMLNVRCPMLDVNFHEYFFVKLEIRFASCITFIMHFMEIPLTKLITVSSALSLFFFVFFFVNRNGHDNQSKEKRTFCRLPFRSSNRPENTSKNNISNENSQV